MEAKNEEVTGVIADTRQKRLWRWLGPMESYKLPLFCLMLFALFALRVLYPEGLSFKRHKSYRFKASALGFFVGDLSLFHTSTTDEAETRIVEVFPMDLQPKVQKVIRPVLTLCEKHNVDPFWVLSVMWTESHFKLEATSKSGARGLMQIMPDTYAHLLKQMREQSISLESDRGEDYLASAYSEAYKEFGYQTMVHKLRNLELGIYYLKSLLKDFDQNHFHATVAYNMGPAWTKERLKNEMPVGKKNHYLNKVWQAYLHITKNLSHNANISFVSQHNDNL